jgi:diguanylate cyclase (GGDEF)-like protein
MLRKFPNQSELYDENVFKTLVEYEIARSQRYPSPISLLRIGLALINPSQNDAANAPAALAAMLNMRLRQADIPARIGNEFVVLLPNTDEISGRAVAERLLRIAVGTVNTPLGFSNRVTICIGLACHSGGPILTVEQLMSDAETALKQARSVGPQTCRSFSDTLIRKH